MKQKLLLISILLLFISCSQKAPAIDGKANKFTHHFYPATIDMSYSSSLKSDDKYPLIFLFSAFEGMWGHNHTVKTLQNMGYHVVTIGYYDDYGLSNNLSRVNINGLKKVMDSYKTKLNVDAKAIGIIGKGKGAELALVTASLYPDIKMVVGISASHVVFQASNITLLNYSSWVHDGKELDFVSYPKFTLSAMKSIYRLIVKKDDYRKLHFLALEDKEAVAKARIKVENINGSIFLASAKTDKLWPSTTMSNEIIKRLKEKKFTHNYEHKAYDTNWFLSGQPQGWNDVFMFVNKNLPSTYTDILFKHLDKDLNNGISIDEYIAYRERKNRDDFPIYRLSDEQIKEFEEYKRTSAKAKIKQCDKDTDNRLSKIETTSPICHIPTELFELFDSNHDSYLNHDELKSIPIKYEVYREPLYIMPDVNGNVDVISVRHPKYSITGLTIFKCDTNHDAHLDENEAISKSCGFTHEEFIESDINRDGIYSNKDNKYRFYMRQFNNLDSNQDTVLDFNEAMKFY